MGKYEKYDQSWKGGKNQAKTRKVNPTQPPGTAYKGDSADVGEESQRGGDAHKIGCREGKKKKKKKKKEKKRAGGKGTRTQQKAGTFISYLLQFLQGGCIDASFLKVDVTRKDDIFDDSLVNFTLYF